MKNKKYFDFQFALFLGLNTVPAQTDAHENHLLIAQQQQLQQLIDAQTIQVRAQQQEIEAARHFGRL